MPAGTGTPGSNQNGPLSAPYLSPGEIVTGIPALPHRVFLKASAVYRRLPEMYKTLQRLQKQLP